MTNMHFVYLLKFYLFISSKLALEIIFRHDHKTEERNEETVLMEMTNCNVVGGNVHQPYDPHEHRASKSPTT